MVNQGVVYIVISIVFFIIYMEKGELAIKYSVERNMDTIACLIGNSYVINGLPVNFSTAMLVLTEDGYFEIHM